MKSEDYQNEYRDNESFLITNDEIGSDKEDIKPQEKLAQEAVDELLTIKAEDRQETCWCFGCNNKTSVWVREVQFDLKGDKSDINHAIVSSRDYPGPIPGFCFGHISVGPKELAEAVYWDKTEIYLGLRPRKWWVIFTDGTKQGGLCEVLNPKNLKPKTYDLHIKR